ncbi:MAG: hypothetical protein RLZZ58_1918 [Pseudomonadota bacterium]
MATRGLPRARRAALLLLTLALTSCSVVPEGRSGPRSTTSTLPPPVASAPRPVPIATGPGAARPIPAVPMATLAAPPLVEGAGNAYAAGLVVGPAVADLPIDAGRTRSTLAAFRLSCPGLLRRSDASGLTQAGDWQTACDAAKNWPDADAAAFFDRHMGTVQVGDGRAFATGYFEPEIAGSRTPRAGYAVPVYAKPADLVEVDLGLFSAELKDRKIRGRVDAQRFVPYFDRTGIEQGALAGRGLEIAWVADPVEFFFLQVQGSGRLRLPDGSVMRIGYDSQNGRDYVGIGKLLRDRGELAAGQASMQGIVDYLRADPARGTAVMRENPSWIFFREVKGDGPLGAMGYPVTGGISMAADPKFVPLGAPVFVSMDRAEPNGLWVAQDTGGAIKGPNRFDTFWGAGANARAIAGGMSARGAALILLPKASIARLTAPR